jgi:hypothetical protein
MLGDGAGVDDGLRIRGIKEETQHHRRDVLGV